MRWFRRVRPQRREPDNEVKPLPLPERLGGIDILTPSGHHSQRCCFHTIFIPTDRPTYTGLAGLDTQTGSKISVRVDSTLSLEASVFLVFVNFCQTGVVTAVFNDLPHGRCLSHTIGSSSCTYLYTMAPPYNTLRDVPNKRFWLAG